MHRKLTLRAQQEIPNPADFGHERRMKVSRFVSWGGAIFGGVFALIFLLTGQYLSAAISAAVLFLYGGTTVLHVLRWDKSARILLLTVANVGQLGSFTLPPEFLSNTVLVPIMGLSFLIFSWENEKRLFIFFATLPVVLWLTTSLLNFPEWYLIDASVNHQPFAIAFTMNVFIFTAIEFGVFVSMSERFEADLIAARQQAEASRIKADAANRAKSSFLANMSHEIRTPMNAILGFGQLLLRDPELNSTQLESVEVIHRSGEYLLKLIDEVLEISKIEAERLTLNPATFDLTAALNDLNEMFRLRANTKGIALDLRIDDDVPRYAIGDSVKLAQILINLVGNAVKFVETGRIEIRVRSTGDSPSNRRLVVEVEDTGPGIAPAELNTLFDAFVQTETGRQQSEGTGLGLAISQAYAELMGGSISVESQIGKGSTFRLNVELEEGDASALVRASERRVTGIKSAEHEIRILIADDRATNRLLLARMLQPIGFVIREVNNGRQALEAHREWQPDLILMDVRMPEMNGIEATKEVRKIDTNTPIIAISASVLGEEEAEMMSAGVTTFIRKPVREQELLDTLGKALHLEYDYIGIAPRTRRSKVNVAQTTSPTSGEPKAYLSNLPTKLVQDLKEALLRADADVMRSIIDEVATHDGEAAVVLRGLVDEYQFDALEKLL